ncbi:MAG: cytochrome c oxidase subunit 3 [Thermoanaerobaculales bacterium]|nr:cytochrome c oxidase subunit 3 [Thermoanaerobaculales bacterium]
MTTGPAAAAAERRRLGLWLFLASLGMLFGGCLVGFVVIRLRAPEWPPPGSPPLPGAFWVSTAVLAALSAVLVAAGRAAERDRRVPLTGLLSAAGGLAIGFIASQVAGWSALAGAAALPQGSLYLFGVWVLSFLHLLHAVGGLVPLVWAALRARRGRYTSTDHEGVTSVAIYWHFLGVVWLAILAVLAL